VSPWEALQWVGVYLVASLALALSVAAVRAALSAGDDKDRATREDRPINLDLQPPKKDTL
jgi:hypothetical protein